MMRGPHGVCRNVHALVRVHVAKRTHSRTCARMAKAPAVVGLAQSPDWRPQALAPPMRDRGVGGHASSRSWRPASPAQGSYVSAAAGAATPDPRAKRELRSLESHDGRPGRPSLPETDVEPCFDESSRTALIEMLFLKARLTGLSLVTRRATLSARTSTAVSTQVTSRLCSP